MADHSVKDHQPDPCPSYLAREENCQMLSAATTLKVFVKGFRKVEWELLRGTIKVSQRRTPRLELVTGQDARQADVVMLDGLDAEVMQWAASQPWLEHKAVIWVDRKTAAKGHTVRPRPVQWPSLPMLLAKALEHAPKGGGDLSVLPAGTNQFSYANHSVLVIDDSFAVRAYLRSLLEAKGITVSDAVNAELGIKVALTQPFACVLMDVLMPGMDGYEACRAIKAQARHGNAAAVVMLTSKSSPFDRIRGKMAGCDAYLTKPPDQTQLYEVVGRYVQPSLRHLNIQKTMPVPLSKSAF